MPRWGPGAGCSLRRPSCLLLSAGPSATLCELLVGTTGSPGDNVNLRTM